MSFWSTSENKPVQAKTSFEVDTNPPPIPSGTLIKSIVTEAKWADYQGDQYINIRWDVIEGQFKGRVIFQKIRVQDTDDKKRDRAIEMLAAIDANAGGRLLATNDRPTDVLMMQHLCNKPMVIRTRVWAMEDENTGEKKQGNWIDGVFAASALNGQSQPKAAPVAQPQQSAPVQQPAFDEDIGF